MSVGPLPWSQVEHETEFTLTFDVTIYSIEAIERAAYWVTDRCYVKIEELDSGQTIRVRLVSKNATEDLRAILGGFGNRVLDEQLRRQIARETGAIRDIIVAQAFAEANLDEGQDADYREDPEGIGS